MKPFINNKMILKNKFLLCSGDDMVKKLCKNCEKELNYDWIYCPYCGTLIN